MKNYIQLQIMKVIIMLLIFIIISVIYCKYFPEYEKVFKQESTRWQNSFKKHSRKFKKRRNSVCQI